MSDVFEIVTDDRNHFRIIQQPDNIERGTYQKRIGIYYISSRAFPEDRSSTLYIQGEDKYSNDKKVFNTTKWIPVLIKWCNTEGFLLKVDGKFLTNNLGEL